MVTSSRDANLNELSTVIGELRNFAAAQVTTNTHIVAQLKDISERIVSMGETGVVLAQYRETLHERFGKIHEHFADLDRDVEAIDTRLHNIETAASNLRSNWKLLVFLATIMASLLSAIVSAYGHAVLKLLLVPTG